MSPMGIMLLSNQDSRSNPHMTNLGHNVCKIQKLTLNYHVKGWKNKKTGLATQLHIAVSTKNILSALFVIVHSEGGSQIMLELYDIILKQTSPRVLKCVQSPPPPILWVIRVLPYRNIVDWLAIIIPTCHSQYRKSAWNPLFSTMGQIDQVDRRFNLYPTTRNCIHLVTLN